MTRKKAVWSGIKNINVVAIGFILLLNSQMVQGACPRVAPLGCANNWLQASGSS
jgi:hypothetical protein